MTRKDCELIASAIKDSFLFCDSASVPGLHKAMAKEGIRLTTKCLADSLEDTNPLFDRSRFLKACGVV